MERFITAPRFNEVFSLYLTLQKYQDDYGRYLAAQALYAITPIEDPVLISTTFDKCPVDLLVLNLRSLNTYGIEVKYRFLDYILRNYTDHLVNQDKMNSTKRLVKQDHLAGRFLVTIWSPNGEIWISDMDKDFSHTDYIYYNHTTNGDYDGEKIKKIGYHFNIRKKLYYCWELKKELGFQNTRYLPYVSDKPINVSELNANDNKTIELF